MDWQAALKDFNAANHVESSPEALERETREHLSRIWNELEQAEKKKDPTLAAIPRFYFKKPVLDSRNEEMRTRALLQQKMQKEARTRLLERKAVQLLDKQDLDRLWFLLTSMESTDEETEEKMNYDEFCQVADQMGPKASKEFFSSSTFLKLPMDNHGQISVQAFYQWVVRKNTLLQTRLELSFHDVSGNGYLTEQNMENYCFELIPSLPALQGLQESFIPFYVCTAVRKFFFFLDPKRKGRIAIQDLLSSPILHELFELRRDNLTEDQERNNWFSAASAFAVYGEYLTLDSDQNGMLSAKELNNYGGGGLTATFIGRVFQECHTYDGEMDYKTYLDFVLAMWYKKTPEALAYFFPLFDVQQAGYITSFNINIFFRAVLRKMEENGHELVNIADVKDEIFDMVKPADPLRIVLQDLVNCKVGDTIVGILSDVNAFWAYDNREMLMSHNTEEET